MSSDKKHKEEKKEQKNKDTKINSCQCSDCEEIIKNLQDKNNDLNHKYKRALADYQNLLKNIASEKSDFLKYSLEVFLMEILPVYDNLKISISTLKEEDHNNPWVEGVKYVIKQFQDILANNGVSEIKTVGEKFDYNTMEAVEGKGEKVVSELRPGYILNKKVIIPAKVVIEPLGDEDNIDKI
ncbi:MAG: nucleotide exchange factor GrpE [Patescibacteria group bacterium]|nr:nucleotide exchange factor GrpE [Patescibacteria group bacterium]